MLGNQGVDFLGRLVVVEVAALQGQTFKEGTHQTQGNLRFRDSDEVDGLAIGLQSMESVLLTDFRVVVECAEDNLIVLCKLFYLVESP